MPVLEVTLEPGEMVVAESGELSWMDAAIELTTGMAVGGQGGGFFGALKRAFSGGTFFMTEYIARDRPARISFATKVPGVIFPVEIAPGQSYLVHRHGFLCAQPSVELQVGFQQSLGAGVFGGEGFVLQRVTGQGTAFIELSGEVVPIDLAPGEVLRAHPGHVGMFQDSVQFNITTVPGIANKLFGGDGLFLAHLQGPGRVWMQSLPLPNLAHALVPYLPKPQSSG
jgi:uncharacterized protein (TIGR00266 family)